MDTITHSQVQEIVNRLPATKLPRAYSFLVNLEKEESSGISHHVNFMLLPLNERRRIMAQQAEQMVSHYEETVHEREMWQTGEFINEY